MGFTQPPEDQAVVNQLVYQLWQSEGALMTGNCSGMYCTYKIFFFKET